MTESFMLIAPEPQLKMATVLDNYNLGTNLSIRPIDQKLRRNLLNIVKEKKCSDDCLQLLLESDVLFCAQIPPRSTKADGSLLIASIYRQIAQDILKRMFRSLRIFQWVPEPLFDYCWFLISGTPDNMNFDTLKMLDSEWEYKDQFTNLDWRIGQNEAEDISLGIKYLQKYWDKLTLLFQLDELNNIFTDRNVEKNCLQYAQEYVIGKIEELMKAKYGQDTVVSREPIVSEGKDGVNAKNNNIEDLQILPTGSDEQQKTWHWIGLRKAYSNKLTDLSLELDERVLDKRLDRTLQFFNSAFALTQPHRFIAFTTCLESLFCTNNTEIAFQLASRIAWFISSDQYEVRSIFFNTAKKLYSLRSKIVHGIKYKSDELENATSELLGLIWIAFEKIIADDNLFKIFRDENECKIFLEALNLGKTFRRE